ncbi:hypothetical protein PULV_a3349 [Pseudoalteromonas ulvae UL12]|uniref:LysR family transcriptional regulator n=1 Tax=Pseudoalteromonas ulvae TaxID=107327 RepID=UPI00186B864E|nr:LysR family transcriptional regulator [Pseudoalteromonas ulvae]MBE0365041.1 hypothetical protein [Pseudoalteromonas ulvae UL12]
MPQVSWDDYRIAYQVALDGSLSKAAISLNINHSTVLRHINRLEEHLKVTLFIRHQRGYQLTDAGFVLLNKMPTFESNFAQLHNLLNECEHEIRGKLRITTVLTYSTELNPALKAFIEAHPHLRIEIIATDEIVPLKSGSVHVSIRIGKKPSEPDIIAKHLADIEIGYYAAQTYIDKHGTPSQPDEFQNHAWVLPSGGKRAIPFVDYINQHIKEDNIIYQSNHFPDVHQAVIDGFGIGPLDKKQTILHPHLQPIQSINLAPAESVWFVYHRDLKHSHRVKLLYQFLQSHLFT